MDTVKVDPRLRGDDEGWMAAKALQREGETVEGIFTGLDSKQLKISSLQDNPDPLG